MRGSTTIAWVSAAGLSVAAAAAIALLRGPGALDPQPVQYPRASVTASAATASDDAEAFAAAALASANLRAVAPEGTQFAVTSVETDQDAGVLFGTFRDHGSNAIVPSDPVTVLGMKDGDRWLIVHAGERGFCERLDGVPDTLLSDAEKAYFVGCGGA